METTENNKIDLLNAISLEHKDLIDLRHNDLREILMKYNCPEYGDCIVDEICELFDHPLTNDEN